MLKAHARAVRLIAIFADILVIALALSAAGFLWHASGAVGNKPLLMLLAVLLAATWLFLINQYNLYGSLRRRSRTDLAIAVLMVHLAGGVVLFAALLPFAPGLIFEGVAPMFVVTSLVLLTAEKVLVRSGLGFFRRRGFNTRNLLIVGRPQDVQRFHDKLAEQTDWGLIVLGVVLTEEDREQRVSPELQPLGDYVKIVDVCKAHPVDEVILCTPQDLIPDFNKKLARLQQLGVSVRLVLDRFDQRYSKKELGFFCDSIPFLTISSNKLDTETILLKRCLDIAGSLAGALLTAIIFPVVAIAIKLESPGPVFFGQQRVGENGRLFTVWKFRSMYADAEQRKQELMARNEMQGAIFKINADPRITRVGRFLRRSSLDEFPQFWNVLVGDMSLVGTRPPTPDEVALYENWQRRRISIRPGITGVWQVSGRNKLNNFDDIVRLDLSYIDNWSLWLDIRILFKTVQVVLSREGSC
jgi:exopolysaccharide biosynthesis polyprenyl glycosylphosphotransferase